MERAAKEYLSNVPSGDPRLYLARDYLDHLANGTRPESVRGDWPMLTPMDFHMRAYFLKNPADSNPKLNNCWAVDFVEACINDPRFRGEPGFLDVLRFNTHPEAAILLRKIAAGSVGTDELRQQASMLLVERGDVKSGDEVELQYHGKKNKVSLLSVELDPAYEFCPLPEEIAGEFKNTISATHENNPDLGAIVERYRKIIRQCPAYFPAEFNLAGVLYYHSMNIDEAERIARRLVAEHPDYLFAHSLLLDILSRKKLYKEAEKLLKDTEIPAKTHPDALKIWLKSQFMFYIRQKKTDEAKPFLDALEAFPGKKDPNIDDFKNVYNEIIHIQGMITEIRNGIQNLGNKRRKHARKRK